jgi:hypothetical protein
MLVLQTKPQHGTESRFGRAPQFGGDQQTGAQSFLCDGRQARGTRNGLIIAATEADAEYCALNELGFVTVSATILVSDSVRWASRHKGMSSP